MGIFLLLLAALLWSFVGILVKTAATMVDSSIITLSRFLFGVLFLVIFIKIRDKKLTFTWRNKWILLGAIGKSVNYIFENIGISLGYAYGNVLVLPLQTIIMVIVSTLYLKEHLELKSLISVILCLLGALLISWNGLPLSLFFNTNLITTLLFFISAIGVVFHVLSQKKLIQSMDSAHMNFSVFFVSMLITAIPIPFTFEYTGPFNIWAFLSLVALGLITGLSFYIYANALKKVTFLTAVIVGNSSIIFTLIWSWLIFKEPITVYIIIGALCFLVGIVILNIPKSYTSNFRKLKLSNKK